MKDEDVRGGMKVVPHSKSIGMPFVESDYIRELKAGRVKSLYVVGRERVFGKYCWVLGWNRFFVGGEFYMASDFEPYVEPLEITKARRAGIDPDENKKEVKLEPETNLKAGNIVPDASKIIFHGTSTVVLWEDGTATVANLMHGDKYEKDIGVQVCYTKKMFGSLTKFRAEISNKTDTTYGMDN